MTKFIYLFNKLYLLPAIHIQEGSIFLFSLIGRSATFQGIENFEATRKTLVDKPKFYLLWKEQGSASKVLRGLDGR